MHPQPPDVHDLLRRFGLRPDKSLGQNFLIDQIGLQRVVESAAIQPDDQVLEIGPGLGSLTVLLARQARRVVAVELDSHLIPALREVLRDTPQVQIVLGDILELNPADLVTQAGYLVVANIPYYITSALIRHLLEANLLPRRMVLTVQREVAQRICSEPGDMSLLALSVQVYGAAQVVAHIPAGSFYPAPRVDSAVVRVDIYPRPVIPPVQLPLFFRLAKAGFSQKRKTLRNALSGGMGWSTDLAQQLLSQAGIDPQRRAETLSITEWHRLVVQWQSAQEQQQQASQKS